MPAKKIKALVFAGLSIAMPGLFSMQQPLNRQRRSLQQIAAEGLSAPTLIPGPNETPDFWHYVIAQIGLCPPELLKSLIDTALMQQQNLFLAAQNQRIEYHQQLMQYVYDVRGGPPLVTNLQPEALAEPMGGIALPLPMAEEKEHSPLAKRKAEEVVERKTPRIRWMPSHNPLTASKKNKAEGKEHSPAAKTVVEKKALRRWIPGHTTLNVSQRKIIRALYALKPPSGHDLWTVDLLHTQLKANGLDVDPKELATFFAGHLASNGELPDADNFSSNENR